MAKKRSAPAGALKLNYRRTALIGFAFFGILLLWQVYDSWCPTFLTDIFARRMYGMSSYALKSSGSEDQILQVQWIVGIIMACDNLAALILLPLFGRLSDRTRTPIGKRMPYILVGTFVAAAAFPFIPLFFHRNNVVGMVIMMAVVLLFMMMYRNPAVALMPDITPKPLRAASSWSSPTTSTARTRRATSGSLSCPSSSPPCSWSSPRSCSSSRSVKTAWRRS